MSDQPIDRVLHHLRQLTAAELSDRELLGRFVAHRDEEAFAALVRRHGPLVLGVCRRVLGHAQDAEDACQAAFLVLGRKAASIRKRDALASWLHGVAYRVAAHLKRETARRRAQERPAVDVARPDETPDLTWREVRAALDEELHRLPERLRAPLVLCYLEGKTRDEAARQLGWSVGTVKGRLERGRDRLRARLTRRGLSLGAAAWAAVLTPEAAPAMLPPPVVAGTVKAALAAAAGRAAGTEVSVRVAALAEGGLKAMAMSKWKIGLGLLLTVAVAGTGLGLLSEHLLRAGPGDETPGAKPAPAPKADRRGVDELRKEVDRLRRENERIKTQLRQVQGDLAVLRGRLEAAPPEKEVHYQGKPLSHWLDVFRDRDRQYRLKAVPALTGIAEVDPKALNVLTAALKDRDAGIRVAAAQALGRLADPKTVPALTVALKDPGAGVQAAAAQALGKFGKAARPAIPALVDLLGNAVAGPKAIQTLVAMGSVSLPALARRLKDEDKDVRVQVVAALGGEGREAVPLLVRALKDPDVAVREQAAKSLGYIGMKIKGAQPGIVFKDTWTNTYIAAAAPANAGADARAAVPALIEALKTPDEQVKIQVIRSLGALGQDARAAVRALVRIAKDPEEGPEVRSASGSAVWDIDPRVAALAGIFPDLYNLPAEKVKPSLPAVLDALKEKDPKVRRAAAKALGRIPGALAREVIPALADALKDESAAVRSAAAHSLEQVKMRR